MRPRLTRRRTPAGDVLVVAVEGDIDISNSYEIAQTLFADTAAGDTSIVLDLSGVRYLDSAGVHLVLDLQQRLRGRRQELHLVVPPGSLFYEVLELTAVTELVPVHPSVDQALA